MNQIWEPFWSTDFKIESGGRYPLGLNHFHLHLESLLSRNIVINSDRLRYISFYCWAIGDINKNEPNQKYEDFVLAFQKRENAFSLALYIQPDSSAIRGSIKLSKVYKENKLEYDTTFHLMESNQLGAFGLYYGGTMYGFGLIGYDEKKIPYLTESGKKIYDFMESRYRNTKYYTKFKGKKNVSTEALIEWGNLNNLDNIKLNKNSAEIESYINIIFHLESTGREFRRETFLYYLYLMEKCARKNIEFNNESFWCITYFSKYKNSQNQNIEFEIVPPYLESVHFYWKIYFGHSMFRWWIEEFFRIFLKHLRANQNGLTIPEFINNLDIKEFNNTINFFLGYKNDYWNSEVNFLLDQVNTIKNINEYKIHFDETNGTDSSMIARMVLILSFIFDRFRLIKKDPRFLELELNLENDLWFAKIYNDFSKLKLKSVKDLVIEILKNYVISQHDSIMIQKNDLRRYWFTLENNRYLFQSDTSPIWGDGHFYTIISYLRDLSLIDDKNKITNSGENLLNKIQKDYYST